MTGNNQTQLLDAVVVGAGAAGVGISVALLHAGIDNFWTLDRTAVGASFAAWPEETRFITPSFPTNSIGMLDLNSVAIGTSPAITLQAEHPTGKQYADYLTVVAQHFGLPIFQKAHVLEITKVGDEFQLQTPGTVVRTKHLIWAAGEFQYPDMHRIGGKENWRHTATVERYDDLEGDDFTVIGGYESGIDCAYHLASRGKRVRLFDKGCPWESTTSDPSVALSTYSMERMRDPRFVANVDLLPNTPIVSVGRDGGTYVIEALDGYEYESETQPLFAGGFVGSHQMVADLFERREDGFPLLSDNDESTITPGLFLCGPAVRHGEQSFCFIYKYRQRFAVVAKAIATALGRPAEQLEMYRMWGMYLDDLSCCGQECVC
ncbi:MAG: NAD(P)/FAD-dependent oxidoreductase [Actinomycetota bacterium]